LLHTGQRQSIKAVSDGTVLFAGPFMSYGFMIVVEHPGDWYSVYGHLTECPIEKGESIMAGDVLGWTSPIENGRQESYFELRFYGKPVDPLPWLARR